MNPTLPIHSEPARWTSRFGYTAAVLTIVFAVVAPILCLGPISAAIPDVLISAMGPDRFLVDMRRSIMPSITLPISMAPLAFSWTD